MVECHVLSETVLLHVRRLTVSLAVLIAVAGNCGAAPPEAGVSEAVPGTATEVVDEAEQVLRQARRLIRARNAAQQQAVPESAPSADEATTTTAAAETSETGNGNSAEAPAEGASSAALSREAREALKSLEQVQRELARRKGQPGAVPAARRDAGVHLVLETPYLGSTSSNPTSGVRYFAARLILVNLTDKAITVKREQISLHAGGTDHPLKDVPPSIQYQSFLVGNRSFSLRDLNPDKQVTASPGGAAGTWVIFSDLPKGANVLDLKLKVALGEKPMSLDVNEYTSGQLALTTERIGPRNSLALLTIRGEINSINVGTLVRTLEDLALQQVARAVIRWTDDAAPVDAQIATWLVQSAIQSGRENRNTRYMRFPSLPVAISELHLSGFPKGSSTMNTSTNGPVRVHQNDRDAVTAALRSAYAILPAEEIVREVQEGHELTRAAALAAGGGRLSTEQLPLILQWTRDSDAALQQAALRALRNFGDPAAIDALIAAARGKREPHRTIALSGLASSRFAAAHRALLALIEEDNPPIPRPAVVKILARYPRPEWGETIFRYVEDADAQVSVEALRALTRIGHPRLSEVLEKSLQHRDANVRSAAFEILADRNDPESEELATRYLLEQIEKAPPTAEMNTFLNRTRDPRAIEPLLRHLRSGSGNRSSLIQTLARLGDQYVAEELVKIYPKLKGYEKNSVLSALLQLRSPRFRDLAGEALSGKDSSLISTACQGLQQDGGPEAVAYLAKALETSGNSSTWSYAANALATIATSDARKALQKARDSNNQNKRSYAMNALRTLRRRSPGYQYIYQAQHYLRQKKYKEALAQYEVSLQLDPQLPEAWSGRGNIYLKQDKLKEARNDFEQALRFDPYSGDAVTGLAIVDVMQGDYEKGIKAVEKAKSSFQTDRNFAYNMGCVYSRALEQVQQDKDAADRDKLLKAYQEKAIEGLQQAVKLGFRDFQLMSSDPDLKPLADVPEFKKLAAGQIPAQQQQIEN